MLNPDLARFCNKSHSLPVADAGTLPEIVNMGFFGKLFGSSSKTTNLRKLLNQGALLIDVRSRDEFKSGHAAEAVNIPLQLLVQSKEKLRNKVVIAVCRTGARSAMAVNLLRNEGIKAFDGGAWDAWAKA